MLLTPHRKMLFSLVLCSRQFFQVNKASLQRTSSTIILLMFENLVNNILFVLLVCLFLNRLIFSHVVAILNFSNCPRVTTPHPPGSYYIHPKDIYISESMVVLSM